MMQKQPKTIDATIILVISGCLSLSILPFVVLRFISGELDVAILNTVAVSITASIFVFVYTTHRTQAARWLLSILSMVVMLITVAIKGPEQVVWVYPSLTTIFFLLPAHMAAIISTAFLSALLLILSPSADFFFLLKVGISAGATLLFCYAFSTKMRGQQHYLELLAITDPLTRVGNRRALEEQLLGTVSRLNRYRDQSASLIMLDVDHFKQVNDQLGHACGDKVLMEFAELVQLRIRDSDALFRFGGEEFVVLLENTDAKEALLVAETLRNSVLEHHWLAFDSRITVSAGVAQYINGETMEEWLGRADDAMYEAKTRGRNACIAAH
ncbi:GGDEF domain-containing protein [Alteromonas oceanisediminis]|uniref:GGDEF domain-containing protein n=1 Tax=Alteromonas oceanisediminis TaxID=2836180 RepID=UPI001BDA44E8|nr:GGDEF domain-containing protein [Alteromonas oceanisediminis]MBT0585939.1 GGDEF domain-containing protein [Alteromonas oceanisediminis]